MLTYTVTVSEDSAAHMPWRTSRLYLYISGISCDLICFPVTSCVPKQRSPSPATKVWPRSRMTRWQAQVLMLIFFFFSSDLNKTRRSSLCAYWEPTRQDETAFFLHYTRNLYRILPTFSQHTTSGRIKCTARTRWEQNGLISKISTTWRGRKIYKQTVTCVLSIHGSGQYWFPK